MAFKYLYKYYNILFISVEFLTKKQKPPRGVATGSRTQVIGTIRLRPEVSGLRQDKQAFQNKKSNKGVARGS